MILTPDTWIVSDTHFGHKNIVKYCNRPKNHNKLMEDQWRTLVQPEDTVLHLGDLAVWYGPEEENWLDLAATLPGKKYLLRGNHDMRKDKVYTDHGFTLIPEFVQVIDGKRILFSHAPDSTRFWEWDINVHGHVHNSTYRDDPSLPQKRDYRNVSVEVMDYKPTRLKEIIKCS